MAEVTSRIPSLRTALVAVTLIGAMVGLTGCAHDRHTGAVIGGVVGATIGYVIATEHKKSKHYDHHPYHEPHYPKKHHYPSHHDPYCK